VPGAAGRGRRQRERERERKRAREAEGWGNMEQIVDEASVLYGAKTKRQGRGKRRKARSVDTNRDCCLRGSEKRSKFKRLPPRRDGRDGCFAADRDGVYAHVFFQAPDAQRARRRRFHFEMR